MMYAFQSFLQAASKRAVKQIDCPEIDLPVYVRILSAKEAGEIEVLSHVFTKVAEDPTSKPDVVRSSRTKLATYYLAEPDGARATDDASKLEGVDWRILERVVVEGMRYNAENTPSFADQKKSSPVDPGPASDPFIV